MIDTSLPPLLQAGSEEFVHLEDHIHNHLCPPQPPFPASSPLLHPHHGHTGELAGLLSDSKIKKNFIVIQYIMSAEQKQVILVACPNAEKE